MGVVWCKLIFSLSPSTQYGVPGRMRRLSASFHYMTCTRNSSWYKWHVYMCPDALPACVNKKGTKRLVPRRPNIWTQPTGPYYTRWYHRIHTTQMTDEIWFVRAVIKRVAKMPDLPNVGALPSYGCISFSDKANNARILLPACHLHITTHVQYHIIIITLVTGTFQSRQTQQSQKKTPYFCGQQIRHIQCHPS